MAKGGDISKIAAMLTLAREAHQAGDNAAALKAVSQVLAQAATAEAWDLKGDILLAMTQLPAAVDAYRNAVDLAPANAVYAHDLARSLLQSGRPGDALPFLRRATGLKAGAWDILCDLGTAQLELGLAGEAVASFSKALTLKPDAVLAHFNRGNALQELGRLDEAEASFRAALGFAPTFVPAAMSLATLLSDLGRLSEAEPLFARAKGLSPGATLFNQAYALVKLRYGQLREGFAAYESRFQASRYGLQTRPFTYPRWQGEGLAGRHILIWTEQGLGDEILSAGMFPEVIAAAGSCTIECSERSVALFQRSFPRATVVSRQTPADPATSGPFDFQSPALSLGTFLRPAFAAFPTHAGYLRPDEALKTHLRAKYKAGDPNTRVVGISWDSTARHGARKRLPLQAWKPILSLPGFAFVSLQYGVGPDDADIKRLGLTNLLIDGEVDALKSLDASAAQVGAMDLVLTVSNTTAHLAGAQNIPVWTLLPDGPGCFWYWFRDRMDSPWYPSMRIFRQPRPGAWDAVVNTVAQALVEIGT